MSGLEFFLRSFKPAIFLVGGVLLVFQMSANLWLSIRETSPTEISVDRWNTDYHGQHWIRLSGVAAPELGTQQFGDVFVPIVTEDYTQGDLIRAVVRTKASMASNLSGPVTIEGLVLSPGRWTLRELMPRESFADEAICVSPGLQPDGFVVPICFMLLGVFFAVLSGWALRKLFRVPARGVGFGRKTDANRSAFDSNCCLKVCSNDGPEEKGHEALCFVALRISKPL